MKRIQMKILSLVLVMVMVLMPVSTIVMAASVGTDEVAPELLSTTSEPIAVTENSTSETTENDALSEELEAAELTTVELTTEELTTEEPEATSEQEDITLVVYDPQPATLNEVNALITTYDQAFQEAMAQGGMLAAIAIPKPHWEFAVPASLMPRNWRCDFVDWDDDFGADYYTFFMTPMTTALFPVTTDASLRSAIATAASGDTIEIQNDITLSNSSVEINNKNLNITSDMTIAGAPFTLTQTQWLKKHFDVKNTASLTLNDIVLSSSYTYNPSTGAQITSGGGGITVQTGGTVDLNNGTVIQGCSPAGVVINTQGHLIMNNGATIEGCGGPYGGVTLNGTDNTFDMHGGTITKNMAWGGGGVNVEMGNGKIRMSGGKITKNISEPSTDGGGVNIKSSLSATGAHYRPDFIMSGGEITDNKARQGGGVFVFSHATFEFRAGTISGNIASDQGGGIYVKLMSPPPTNVYGSAANNYFILGDSTNTASIPIIDNNIAMEQAGGCYVQSGTYPIEMYNGVISNNKALNLITLGAQADNGGLIVQNSKFNMYDGKITGNEATFKGNTGGVLLRNDSTFTMYDGEISNNIANGNMGGVHVAWGSTFILGDPNSLIPGNPKINNNTAAAGDGGGIGVNYARLQPGTTPNKVEMYSGEISGNNANNGGGVLIIDGNPTSTTIPTNPGAHFEMYGGIIDTNEARTGQGGGIVTDGKLTNFHMYNGAISNNKAKTNGGGLSITSGNAFMYDGTITNNNAEEYGGGVFSGSKLLMENSANPALFTGVLTGSFIMGDPIGTTTGGNPIISNNNATLNGGGVAVARVISLLQQDDSAIFKTLANANARITGNKALSGNGGGIYTMDMTYANIQTASNTVFAGNQASITAAPPTSASSTYPAIGYTGTSIPATNHPINNYDINKVQANSLTIRSSDNTIGSILTPVAGSYLPGTAIYIKAQLDDPSQSFINWTSNNGGSFINALSIFTYYTTTNKNVTLTANFTGSAPSGGSGGGGGGSSTATSYSITMLDNGYGTGTASATSAVPGTDITLTAKPNTGYRFKEWQIVNGGITIANNKFTMPSANVTVKAIFEPIDTKLYSITVQNDGHGKASADLTSASSGTTITLTAKPNSGYQFKEWQIVQGDITITDDQFIMPSSNVTVKAIFKPIKAKTYSITVQSSGNGKASANPTTATPGSEITLTATPNSGYRFKEWQIVRDGISVKSNTFTIVDNKFIMPDSDVVIKAIFVKKAKINIPENVPGNRPSKTPGKTPVKTPNTGDFSNPIGFTLLALGSLSTIGILAYIARKKKNK